MERDFRRISTTTGLNLRAFGPFEEENRAPCDAKSIETFKDLGLSDRQIARYFRITETGVVSLRRYYGLDR